MNQLPDNISFEIWVKFVFDHPESEKAWYHKKNRDNWNADKRSLTAVRYMTQLFTNASTILTGYSNLQLQHSLWFLANISCSDHSRALFSLDNPVSTADRVKCIHSMYALYKAIFAPRCSANLSHLEHTHNNPLNVVCYMWWDLLPVPIRTNEPGRDELNEACLHVMTRILELDSMACQESALHGLGHWASYNPKRVSQIVGVFLKQHPNLESGLKKYALAAQEGHVQ